nr:serpin family protein [Nocardioides zeae]
MRPDLDLGGRVAAYADRLHRTLGDTHHVVSPLGVWLVLVLAGTAATRAETQRRIADVLGVDPQHAAEATRALVDAAPVELRLAVGAWVADAARQAANPAAYDVWSRSLPRSAGTGPIPSQAELDAWADEHTDGMIPRFPADVPPTTSVLLASAVMTRISWAQPFRAVPAAELGGRWAEMVERVLRSPVEHPVAAVEVDGARYAVHRAASSGDTTVLSVVAEDPGADPADVVAAAHRLALGGGTVVPLADLPLGEGPVWTVVEEDGFGSDRTDALLPAWSADTEVDLRKVPSGVDAGFAALAELLPPAPGEKSAALQKCVARYSREGFEAAAVTAMMRAASGAPIRGRVRRGTARFARPYAVVATVRTAAGPLPAFSGWITEPVEAD